MQVAENLRRAETEREENDEQLLPSDETQVQDQNEPERRPEREAADDS